MQEKSQSPFRRMWTRRTDFWFTGTGIFLVGVVQPFFWSRVLGSNVDETLIIIGAVFTNTTLLWLGCRKIVTYLSVKLPWTQFPVKHLVVEILAIVLYTLIISVILHGLGDLLQFKHLTRVSFIVDFAVSTFISIIISLAHEGIFFFHQWKTNLIKAETLEKENILTKYETLKNQVNPHFLFNTLNTLLGLIDENKEMASEYVESMALFYRKLLEYGNQNLVTVREELEMIDLYYGLQKIRYGKGFILEVDLFEDDKAALMPPLTLQMLVENALKHNSTAISEPLIVNVSSTEKQYLTVKNNLQPRSDAHEGTGLGLKNIINRYALVTSKEVFINKNLSYFTVALPLITQKFD